MRYFANPSTPPIREAMAAGLIGMVDTPKQYLPRPAGVAWCADNGCWGKGWIGDPGWATWLANQRHDAARCVFATAPDVVGNAAKSLRRSLPWLPFIRALGYPAALVAQDGLEQLRVPWDAFDVLFIGGSTDWKLGPAARALVAEANARGKHTHLGRVNSERRYAYAELIGCDSADGTYLVFGPDKNLPQLLRWGQSLFSGDAV